MPARLWQAASVQSTRSYRHYDLLLGAFVTVHLCSTLIGTAKVASLFGVEFGAVTLFFPLSYVIGDVVTEVYGFARARRIVWAGVAAIVFASIMSMVVVGLPPAPAFAHQEVVELAFGQTPRLAVAGLVAYFCGELVNSYVLARMKVRTRGRWLWARTIGSTLVGEAVDSLIFFPVAFYGVWPTSLLVSVLATNYVVKVGVEVLVTPVTYRVVGLLKRAEGEDFYDAGTTFAIY